LWKSYGWAEGLVDALSNGKREAVMEKPDGQKIDRTLLTREEASSLSLLEPLLDRHLAPILEALTLHLGSDPDGASLLSDDLAVARLKRSQREYLLSMMNGASAGSVDRDGASVTEYRDPFGLGSEWHVRSFIYFLTSMQPLVFEAFGATPHLYHKIWNALLKVIFRDIELALNASLKQRDDLIEAAKQDATEARKTLDYALSKQVVEEQQRQAEHRTVVNLLTTWLTKTSELAQEMGTPLNVILWRAESLLERTEEETAQAALQSIIRQVEQLIPLRQKLCALDHGPEIKPPASAREAPGTVPLSSGTT
jgi:signal transduction histidine kinase